VIRAQRVAGVRPGDSVAVLGSGISGVLHIQFARATGAGRIVATDLHEYRLRKALEHGADAALPATGDVPARLREVNGGRAADRVLVCTASPSALSQAIECVDRGGTILVFAPAAPEVTFPLPLWRLWRDGITLTHSYAGPPAELRVALDLIAAGRVNVASMVTHRLGLAETGRGFSLVERAADSLKVVVEPQR
jgi:L-iditol 2-dehydrogenase